MHCIAYIVLYVLHSVHHILNIVFHALQCMQCILCISPIVLRAPAEKTKVATVLGIFPHFLLFIPLFKTPEGVVVLFQIFACGPELPIEYHSNQKKNRDPPLPPAL